MPRARFRRAGCVVIAVAALVGVSGCSDDKDPNEPDAKAVLDVEKSTCLLIEGTLEAEVTDLPVIDCDVPHTHEIFDKVKDTEHEIYPGFAELEQLAQLECYTSFEEFVDVSPFDSTLFISWLVPTLDGWNEENDREILCVLGRRDGGQLPKSAEDTQW